ncbi:MAG: ABC transporter ATP-binding protein [Actinobacteria bacterium]|nr:ABC transporter ATP-binding protein [Actinomycetota bacterium]
MTIQPAGTSLAVDIQHVGKRFKRHSDRRNSIKERLVRGRARKLEDFWAVRDVTLQIPKGSVYGLIGHNGSGKSTLLKMIGGIYRPTEGSITTDGRVAALIELGAGFHPDMTGRENINLNGSILGLPRKDIQAVTEEIIEFSGLGDFINDPVKHYSSGMYVRLGFSVAVHMKPDVLVVDEVLAVGDEEFQRKCFDHLYALRRSGRTIIVVSHGLGQLEALCDEIAWLEHGEVQKAGPPTETIAAYLKRVNSDEAARNPQIEAVRDDEGNPRAGDQSIRVRSARIVDLEGNAIGHAETGTTFQISLEMAAREPVLGPNVRIALQHESGPLVTMMSNHRVQTDFGIVEGNRTITVALTDNPLLPGRYRVHVDVFDFSGSKLLDSWNDAVEFPVRSQSGEIGQGFVQLPVEFSIT